jgi:hypothetical protein
MNFHLKNGYLVPGLQVTAPFAGYFLSSLVIAAILLVSAPRPVQAEDLALTVFSGRITGVSAWHEIITHPDDLDWQDAYFVAGALAYNWANYYEDALSLELEGQVAYHFGDQHLWEFNLPVVARWQRFPWNSQVKTSTAFGLGPSYTTKVPPVEVAIEGESRQFLYHWFLELTFGPPDADWTTSFRLHHRSGGFGSIADEGGSNGLAFGIRFPL